MLEKILLKSKIVTQQCRIVDTFVSEYVFTTEKKISGASYY